jgi:hypothetical protein
VTGRTREDPGEESTRRGRVERYLFSRRNLVGSALAFIGLALYGFGVIGGVVWLPVVVGLYLAGALLVPREKGVDVRLGAAGDVDAIREGLDRLTIQVRGRIADDLYAKVIGIRDSILATLPAGGTTLEGVSERQVFLIRQTALDYLPEALDAYLSMPRTYAERRAVSGGRTPHDVLLEQLDILDGAMKEVTDDIRRHDADRLMAHGRFLSEKFSKSRLSIDAVPAVSLGRPAAPAAPATATDVASPGGTTEATPAEVQAPAPAAAPSPPAGTTEAEPQAADRERVH